MKIKGHQICQIFNQFKRFFRNLEISKESFELIENLTIYVHLRCFKQNLNKEYLLNLEPFG